MNDRQAAVIRRVQQFSRVTVGALAQQLNTSEVTIRRDLAELESLGLLRRVRGGAVSAMLRGEELPFAMRELENADHKRRIAAAAVELLADGESVVLDGGTTGLAAAHELASRRVTVMPLSVTEIGVLANAKPVSLLLPGGTVRPHELSVVGPMVEQNLAAVRFDTMLLTCCGLDVDHGVTAFDLQDGAVKRAAMRASARVIAMVDGSKFTRSAMAVVCPISALDIVITDDSAPIDDVALLEQAGIRVVRVHGNVELRS
jgi:DeoR/GlpR family transcriptional regulator of sugar metabolism